ncbi:hypothetical protein [Arthrobacter glacialis]|uniref:SPOR domain-containing protein n=1 Tax=Arthrobacter glacialis TaxID=1664 RepID=A0A2S3ZSI3_ARTGL|nr:hypothetical protein [Arthrobacter glacialis]POH72170.1 hypothetical protein CVS27_16890 [Arthrobacter glacialis]
MTSEVWIVQHDETAHNTVLGVFATQDEAQSFAEEVGGRFANGVIFSSYQVGYRYDEGPGYVALVPDTTGTA